MKMNEFFKKMIKAKNSGAKSLLIKEILMLQKRQKQVY